MKYENAKLRQMLAAEYVLGTLRGRARRRFEKQARGESRLRAEIMFWENSLAELGAGLAPIAPPPKVWLDLQHRITADAAKVSPLRRPTASPVGATAAKPASLWRIAAGLATAAAIVVAVIVGQRGKRIETPIVATNPPSVAPIPSPVPPPPPAQPTYVALLKIPKTSLQWTVSLAPERGTVKVAASGEYAKLGKHSLELWVITPGGPVSLGVLPVSGPGELKLPAGLESGETLTLAISLEPVGGSPTGKPTGPVLTSGAAVKAG